MNINYFKFNIIHFLRYLYLIKFNKFEIEINILDKFLNKKSTCIDIGSCHGSYTRILSKYSKTVYAFEPERTNFNYLSKVLNKKNIILKKLALSDKVESNLLYIPNTEGKINTAMSSLFKIDDNKNIKYQKIKIQTLDNFFKRKKIINLDLIKIDVEGAEYKIIQGGRRIINVFKPIMIIETMKKNYSIKKNIFTLLKNKGYFSYYLSRSNLKLKSCNFKNLSRLQSNIRKNKKNKNFFDQSYVQNFIFIHKKSLKKYNYLFN